MFKKLLEKLATPLSRMMKQNETFRGDKVDFCTENWLKSRKKFKVFLQKLYNKPKTYEKILAM